MPFKDFKIGKQEKKADNNFVGNVTSGSYTYKHYMHEYDDFVLYVSNTNYDRKNRDFNDMYITQITSKTPIYKTQRGIYLGSTLQDVFNIYGEGKKSVIDGDSLIEYRLNDMGLSFKSINNRKYGKSY